MDYYSLSQPERSRRRSGKRNLSLPQTLDHHHLHSQPHPLNPPPPPPYGGGEEPNPDPHPAPAQTSSAPNSKAPPSLPLDAAAPVLLPLIRYLECLKNHAAAMGRHVLDGCGEFMPSGDAGTPEALKCAACDCHRSFHRKEIDPQPSPTPSHLLTHNPTGNYPVPHSGHHYDYPRSGPIMLAFGGAGGGQTESSSEDLNVYPATGGTPPAGQRSFTATKKRHRTKFSEEQKNLMHEFGEKLGWKVQKQDGEEVQEFCDRIGVKKDVFKVWMHNNKQAMKRKQM